jgi:hypothetical protein
MKRLYIESYDNIISKIYLLDIENSVQYVGAKKIGSRKEPLRLDYIEKSFIIDEKKFSIFFNSKFMILTKLKYIDFLNKYELQEFLI